MNKDLRSIIEIACVAGGIALVGCSSSSSGAPGAEAGCPGQSAGCPAADAGCPAQEAGCPGHDAGCPGAMPATAGDATTPATGAPADVDAWLAKGDYKSWTCEPAPHAARSPSPHGMNRICSNPKLAANAGGEYAVGAASVKEIYDATGTNVTGYAIGLHMKAGATGDTWYWYEKTQADGVVANGLGSEGTPKTVCVSCHAGAGSDASHAGHDFVYTQVK